MKYTVPEILFTCPALTFAVPAVKAIKGPCEGQTLQGIACVAEVDFSPKPFSNPTWAVPLFKGPMNVIMGYESH